MSESLSAYDVLMTIPGWEAAPSQINELKGGLTNRTYHVRSGEKEFALRISAVPTSMVLPDRSCELAILEEASKAGIAPGVLYADIEKGILLTEYLPGPVWQARDLENPKTIEVLVDILRRVHALPLCGSQTDLKSSATRYAEALQKSAGLHDFASYCVDIINSIPARDQLVCCHNDVVAGNIIGSTPVKLIDWEYAGDNDPLFDLASIIGYHNFNRGRAQHLLSAYAGGADAQLQECLAEQLRLFDALQWLWLATRSRNAPGCRQLARLEELQQRIR